MLRFPLWREVEAAPRFSALRVRSGPSNGQAELLDVKQWSSTGARREDLNRWRSQIVWELASRGLALEVVLELPDDFEAWSTAGWWGGISGAFPPRVRLFTQWSCENDVDLCWPTTDHKTSKGRSMQISIFDNESVKWVTLVSNCMHKYFRKTKINVIS